MLSSLGLGGANANCSHDRDWRDVCSFQKLCKLEPPRQVNELMTVITMIDVMYVVPKNFRLGYHLFPTFFYDVSVATMFPLMKFSYTKLPALTIYTPCFA